MKKKSSILSALLLLLSFTLVLPSAIAQSKKELIQELEQLKKENAELREALEQERSKARLAFKEAQLQAEQARLAEKRARLDAEKAKMQDQREKNITKPTSGSTKGGTELELELLKREKELNALVARKEVINAKINYHQATLRRLEALQLEDSQKNSDDLGDLKLKIAETKLEIAELDSKHAEMTALSSLYEAQILAIKAEIDRVDTGK